MLGKGIKFDRCILQRPDAAPLEDAEVWCGDLSLSPPIWSRT